MVRGGRKGRNSSHSRSRTQGDHGPSLPACPPQPGLSASHPGGSLSGVEGSPHHKQIEAVASTPLEISGCPITPASCHSWLS